VYRISVRPFAEQILPEVAALYTALSIPAFDFMASVLEQLMHRDFSGVGSVVLGPALLLSGDAKANY
jgi:hypothetical protein